MKIIRKNTIIELEDNKKYFIISGENLEGITFCLVSTINPPIEIKVAELKNEQGSATIQQYFGKDYKFILKRLLEKANKENN